MSLGPMEIGLIVLVIVLLFGAKKLPDLARSMGRSMRIFKSEVNEMQSEDTQRSQAQAQLCLLYTSPSPRDKRQSRMPSSA